MLKISTINNKMSFKNNQLISRQHFMKAIATTSTLKKLWLLFCVFMVMLIIISYIFEDNQNTKELKGTFAESYEPRNESVFFVAQENRFVIYDQILWIVEGSLKNNTNDNNLESYNLVLENDNIIGNVIYDNSIQQIHLAYYEKELILFRISEIPTYIEYDKSY